MSDAQHHDHTQQLLARDPAAMDGQEIATQLQQADGSVVLHARQSRLPGTLVGPTSDRKWVDVLALGHRTHGDVGCRSHRREATHCIDNLRALGFTLEFERVDDLSQRTRDLWWKHQEGLL